MIETKFIQDIMKEYQIEQYLAETLKNVGFSGAKLHKTPLGEKIILTASRPGLVVGRKGENIQQLTRVLKSKFKLENPQIEIVEVEKPMLNPAIVAERIASTLERFGPARFKGVGHKMLNEVMDAGAKGVEILISGKIPSSRAKRWRFYQGYLKKSGDIAVSKVLMAHTQAHLKTGTVGIQVRIMPPNIELPDELVPKVKVEEKVEVKKEGTGKEASKDDTKSGDDKSEKKELAPVASEEKKAEEPSSQKNTTTTKKKKATKKVDESTNATTSVEKKTDVAEVSDTTAKQKETTEATDKTTTDDPKTKDAETKA